MKLTVKEYAKQTGKSFQSVYRKIERGTIPTVKERINNKDVLFVLVDETDNSTPVSTEVPQQFNPSSTPVSTEVPHKVQPPFNPNSTAKETQVLEEMVELLKGELRERKQELDDLRKTKDKEIAELHQLLFNQQQLHAKDRALLEAYQSKEHQEETITPDRGQETPIEEHQETKKKRNWWRFFWYGEE
jgi:hypothetical protein